MRRLNKNIFRGTIVAVAALMTIQTAAVKSPSQSYSSAKPEASVVRTAAKGAEALPVKVAKPTTQIAAVKATASSLKQTKIKAAAPVISSAPKSVAVPAAKSTAAKAASTTSEGKQIVPGIIYDATNQTLYGPNGKGILYIGFDYDLKQKLFYSSINPWQKNFGYTKLYDDFAPLTNILFETKRVYFQYNGLDWMIQLWKGIYGITSGAEVGIYNKASDSASLTYNCASEKDYLLMNLEVIKDGQPYFTREEQPHWWLTGFVLGDIVNPKDLTVKTTITMKDQEMTDAFVNALKTQSDMKDVYYSVDGLKVSLDW